MNSLPLYKKYLKTDTLDNIIREFQRSLLKSNMTFGYFCNWAKIKRNVEKYDYEVNILNYLVGAASVKKKLNEILKKNPEIINVLPLIIAVRDTSLSIISDPTKPLETITEYEFSSKTLTEADRKKIIDFCEKAGIIDLFVNCKIKNLKDYLLGVETGLDTNARKNRSGSAMEALIWPILENINGIDIYSQKTFGKIATDNNHKVPEELKDRKFDYVIRSRKKFFNIEVNFYSGQGSKPQEIVDSYINRNNELSQAGWSFIWITDGMGWLGGLNQLKKAFKKMDFVLNVSFAKKGMLKDILSG